MVRTRLYPRTVGVHQVGATGTRAGRYRRYRPAPGDRGSPGGPVQLMRGINGAHGSVPVRTGGGTHDFYPCGCTSSRYGRYPCGPVPVVPVRPWRPRLVRGSRAADSRDKRSARVGTGTHGGGTHVFIHVGPHQVGVTGSDIIQTREGSVLVGHVEGLRVSVIVFS